jgi:hypothetical protein
MSTERCLRMTVLSGCRSVAKPVHGAMGRGAGWQTASVDYPAASADGTGAYSARVADVHQHAPSFTELPC